MSDDPIRLSLSVNGLQRLQTVNHERDFAFIVGDQRYECPSFVAEFLSPRVTSLRSQDITIHDFSIETADPDKYFGTFVSIGFGHEVCLSRDRLPFVRSVCGELWNYELFEKTFEREEGRITEDELKARLEFLSGVNGSCEMVVEIVASHFYELSVSDFDKLSLPVLESILGNPSLVVEDEDSLFNIIHRLASADLSYFGLLEFVRFEFVSADCMRTAIDFISNSFDSFTFGIWSSLGTRIALSVTPPSQSSRFKPLPAIDSKIISTIPEIFSAFGSKTLHLLYRGSRDGFEGPSFHARCNGYRNTVSLISSTNGCIFGGFTPVAWSSDGHYVSDPSLTSFIFTLKNPHNLPAQMFKQKQAEAAIRNCASYGPTFGSAYDLYICHNCHTSNSSYSNLGNNYANDTGLAGHELLTGVRNFTVEENEVFEFT